MIHLIIFLILEPIKRVLSAVLYPLAYALRRQLRTGEVMRPDYLYRPAFAPLWLMLDDSIEMEQGKEYDDKEKRYPSVIWKWHNDFVLAYWWSAIRNSCVNWGNWCAFKLGEMVSEEPHDGKNFYVIRTFASGGKRPYCEFYLFGRWNQVGWISGGRFEIDVMKRRA